MPLVEKEQVEIEKQPISRTDIARTLSLTEAQSRTAIDHLKNNNTIIVKIQLFFLVNINLNVL